MASNKNMHSEPLSILSFPPFNTYTLINIQLVHIHFKPKAHNTPGSFNLKQPKPNASINYLSQHSTHFLPVDNPLHRHAHPDRLLMYSSKDLQPAAQLMARPST